MLYSSNDNTIVPVVVVVVRVCFSFGESCVSET